MARRHRRLLLIPALLAAAYLAAYAWFRVRGDIVHYHGFGPIAHDVRAPKNAWDELLVDLLATTDSIKLNAAALVLDEKAKRLNWLFYPLRRAEARLWNVLDERWPRFP